MLLEEWSGIVEIVGIAIVKGDNDAAPLPAFRLNSIPKPGWKISGSENLKLFGKMLWSDAK